MQIRVLRASVAVFMKMRTCDVEDVLRFNLDRSRSTYSRHSNFHSHPTTPNFNSTTMFWACKDDGPGFKVSLHTPSQAGSIAMA